MGRRMRETLNLSGRMAGTIFLLSLLSIPLPAATFGVTPVRIDLSAGRPNAVIQIENMSDERVLLQAHVVTWSFAGTADQYADTDDILLNPPIFALEPHQRQFVRLGIRHVNESAVERTYRLILEQVPEKPKPGFSGLTTILRISVPVFAIPRTKVSPKVSWHAERTGTGIKLVAVNRGSAHIQLTHFELSEPESQTTPLTKTMTEYLLPGQSKVWEFSDGVMMQAREIGFKAKTDAGDIHEALIPLQP
jgi:fimbrial chaperone protein